MKNTIINSYLKKHAYILPDGVFVSSWSACSTARISSKTGTSPKITSYLAQ
jgi:hypothetical protein